MKNTAKKTIVATLALTIVTACSASPLAMSSRQYKQTIRDICKSAGEKYEQNAEGYPENAAENPATAPKDYVDNCVTYGADFLNQIFGATNEYLGK